MIARRPLLPAALLVAAGACCLSLGQTRAQAPAAPNTPKAPDEQAVMDKELRQGVTPGAAAPDESKLPPLPVHAEILPEKRQAIKDWGAYPAFLRTDWPSGGRHHILDKPDVQQMVYKDLGITLMRTSFFPKSYDEKKDDGTLNTAYLDQTIVAHVRTAQENGVKRYIVSIWSPPPVMKDPPIEEGRDKDGKPSRLRPEREDDYVRYVVNVLDHLKQRGVGAPVAFSVQNELTYPARWDGCKYEPEQYVRVVKKMRRALDAAGYKDTLIFGPESGSYAGNIDYLGGPEMPLMRQDAELRDAVDVIAFHGYSEWSDKDDIPQRMRRWVETAHSLG
jgi:O-glycosyl hydrolase